MSTTVISNKLNIKLSANAEEVKTVLDKVPAMAGKAAEGVNKKLGEIEAGKVGELGEKLNASVGRINAVGRGFEALSADGNIVSKSLATVEIAVGSLTTSMQLASKVASGMKAALLGTGIGVVLVGLGYLVSALRSAGEEERRRREELDEATRRFLERARPGITGGPTGRLEHLGGGMFRRESMPFVATPGEVDVGRRGAEIDSLTRSLDRSREAVGRSAEEMRVLEAESRLVFDRVHVGGPVFEALRERVEALRESFDRSELTRRIGGISDAITRISTERMTLGMSPEDAERYRFSLRRVETEIGGVRVATLESISPLEAHRRRMDELHDSRRRGAISAEAFARRVGDSERALRAETEAMARLERMSRRAREARDALRLRDDGLALRDATRSPLERIRESLRSPTRLLRGGHIDRETFDRAVSAPFRDLLGRAREAPGPARAMERGSAEAISAINAFQRDAFMADPIDRLRAILEAELALEREMAADSRRIADAVTGGLFAPFGF